MKILDRVIYLFFVFALLAPTAWDLQASSLCAKTVSKLATDLRGGDLAIILKTVNDSNEMTDDGQFQIVWMNGQPHIEFNTKQSIYFLNLDNQLLEEGIHPQRAIKRSTARAMPTMERRFKAPDHGILVGLDTTADGMVIPIFSSSRDLSIYRDLSKDDPLSLAEDNEARQIHRVPLAITKYHKIVDQSGDLSWLPEALRDLFKNGYTFSTVYSSTALEQNSNAIADSNDYWALMIADQVGHGRVGILFYKNFPVLVEKRGQEYFIEIKGVGVATEGADRIQNRQGLYNTHLIRSGRTDFYLATQEFIGFRALQEQYVLPKRIRQLLSRPVIAFSLPEFSEKSGNPSFSNLLRVNENELSTQVIRLATSSRRVGYVNPAFGFEYRQLKRGKLMRKAYGYMIGSLAASPRLGSTQSAHAENFIEYPAFQIALPIDYSDIICDYQGEKMPVTWGLGEMQVGYESYSEQLQDFIDGLVEALKEKKLWTDRARDFFQTPRLTHYKINRFLESEYYSYYLLLKVKNQADRYQALSIRLSDYGFERDIPHLIESETNRDTRNNLLRNHYNAQISNLTRIIFFLEEFLDSTLIQRDFPTFASSGQNVLREAIQMQKKYQNDVARYFKERWPRALSEYLAENACHWNSLAQGLDDTAKILGLPTSNVEELRKSALGNFMESTCSKPQ